MYLPRSLTLWSCLTISEYWVKYSTELGQRWQKIKFHRIRLHEVLFSPDVRSRSDCWLSLTTLSFTPRKTHVLKAYTIDISDIVTKHIQGGTDGKTVTVCKYPCKRDDNNIHLTLTIFSSIRVRKFLLLFNISF